MQTGKIKTSKMPLIIGAIVLVVVVILLIVFRERLGITSKCKIPKAEWPTHRDTIAGVYRWARNESAWWKTQPVAKAQAYAFEDVAVRSGYTVEQLNACWNVDPSRNDQGVPPSDVITGTYRYVR